MTKILGQVTMQGMLDGRAFPLLSTVQSNVLRGSVYSMSKIALGDVGMIDIEENKAHGSLLYLRIQATGIRWTLQ